MIMIVAVRDNVIYKERIKKSTASFLTINKKERRFIRWQEAKSSSILLNNEDKNGKNIRLKIHQGGRCIEKDTMFFIKYYTENIKKQALYKEPVCIND
ncbi:hypothetical protein [Bacillus amyloliquefaciens]|uniref:Uncharacterized protein n=1 Tax=Bacillus amyloliquefaciens TaxID=1390 RepID=A0AAP7T9W1_BACAM|nr:hypothetical protein [Bacillus amyloliquefaciens]OIK19764.1 hypothetical protein BKP66_15640 [Bacillus amyloliquefaciens]